MQLKTIRKTIANKLTDWLDSITDEGLRKKLKNKILVSGGSITSLFFNEKVNDYDIYIMDRDVLLELVKYYTKDFPIQILEGWKKDTLIGTYAEFMKGNPDYENRFTVSVNNLKENQLKLFFTDKDAVGYKVEPPFLSPSPILDSPVKHYQPKYFSPNAISLSDDIQIVVRFHGNAEEIHKTFDFIHATNYFTFEEGLVTNKAALESLLTKNLKYQGSLYPVTTVIRIKKFLKRGWNITAGEQLKVLFQISELDLKNPDVLEEQLIGVDVAYFGKLIEILRSIDNPEMSSSYLNTIIDRVFEGFDDDDNINDEL